MAGNSVIQAPSQNTPLFDRRPANIDPEIARVINELLVGSTYWQYLAGLGGAVARLGRTVRYGTHNERMALNPQIPDGSLFVETDTGDVFQWRDGTWVSLDLVLGYAALINAGAITKVTADGTIGESALTDDGTTVESAEPVDVLGCIRATSAPEASPAAGAGIEIYYVSAGDAGLIRSYDRTSVAYKPVFLDAEYVAFLIGGTAAGRFHTNGFFGVGNAAPAYPVDVVGDVNITGDYLINGVPISGNPSADVNLSGQNANIPATNLRPTGVLAPAGLYAIRVYFRVSTAGAAGTLTLTIGFNDGVAASTYAFPLAANSTATILAADQALYTSGASDITYSVSGITAGCVYLVKISLVQVF